MCDHSQAHLETTNVRGDAVLTIILMALFVDYDGARGLLMIAATRGPFRAHR